MLIATAAQMKRAEQAAVATGDSFSALMQRAGTGAADTILSLSMSVKRAVILCGNGNNGGDGFVVANRLSQHYPTTVILAAGAPKTELAAAVFATLSDNITLLDSSKHGAQACAAIADADLIVDAVFGTGFHGQLDLPLQALMKKCNQALAYKVALDLPSGVCSDTADASDGAFCADLTIAFGAQKPAHTFPQTAPFCGKVVVCDIGITPQMFADCGCNTNLLTKEFAAAYIKPRNPHTHKGNYGKLLCVCGCDSMPGAALLSTKAALRTGAGLVTTCSTRSVLQKITAVISEATQLPLAATQAGSIPADAIDSIVQAAQSATAVLVGCGLSQTQDTAQLVRALLQNTASPLVIDADGLNLLSGDKRALHTHQQPVILTPHMGEMARLCGKPIDEIRRDRLTIAANFATSHNVTLVLKDSVTTIASPQGALLVYQGANPGLARGGSGDVLAGIIASLLAQGFSPFTAAGCGVYLHGLAATVAADRYTHHAMLPSDVIDALPQAFAQITACQP